MIVYGNRFQESVGVFDLRNIANGLVDEETTKKVIGDSLYNYTNAEGSVQIKLFKYPNLKVFNKINFQLHQQLAEIVNKQDYDVVHLNGYRGSQMFLYASLKKSGKVWSVHDPVLHSGEEKWQTRLGYSLFRFFDAQFILHNNSQKPEFIKAYGIKEKNCHFVKLGPLEVIKLFDNGSAIETAPDTVLFYGRISPYKGVEYLIKAAKKASSKVPGLKVIIAGKPNYALDITELEGDKTFEFINGFVPNEQLVALIQKASVIVCPYTDATQSGVIMTAYAFNKPVIATRVGGLPEVVDDGITGKLIPAKDVNALAEAIVNILSEKSQLKAFNKNIEKLTADGKFSWKNIAKETIVVYEKAIADR